MPPVAIVFDLPEELCLERNASRPDRQVGMDVIRRQRSELRRSLEGLEREGFRPVEAGNWPLVVVAVVASVAAAFFYLRVLVYVYLRDPEVAPAGEIGSPDEERIVEGFGRLSTAVAGVLAAFVLVVGVFPGLLSKVLEQASVLRW